MVTLQCVHQCNGPGPSPVSRRPNSNLFGITREGRALTCAVSGVLRLVVKLCVAGASVRDVCKQGDQTLEEECQKVYRKDKDLKKGTPTVF